jgi:hypothetical protein
MSRREAHAAVRCRLAEILHVVVPSGSEGAIRVPFIVRWPGQALGFFNIRCGADGPQAWAIAEQWNERWQKVRIGGVISPSEAERRNLSPDEAEELAIYPEGSIG